MSEASVAELVAPESVTEEERRTSYLELFFDLVFVFAITQVTSLILEDTSAAGFGRAVLMLGMVWWAWSGYAWMTNAVDIESAATRLLFLVATAAAFFMALAVPDAFRDGGLRFALPYVVVRVLQVGLYLYGIRGRQEERAAFVALVPWFLLAPAIALAGGFLDGGWRTGLWALSLAVDVVGTLTLGRENGFRISPAHFAERYALFVIIAIGESVVAVGAGASESVRDTTFGVTALVAFAGVAALWWAYFDFTALAVERALRRTPERRRGPFARDVFTFFHFPLVLGVIFYAVAAKKTLAHPSDPLSSAGRWALGIGVAAYLSSFALVRFRAVRLVAWERIAGGAAALVAVVVLGEIDAVALLAVVVGVLVVVTATETARLREVRARVRAE